MSDGSGEEDIHYQRGNQIQWTDDASVEESFETMTHLDVKTFIEKIINLIRTVSGIKEELYTVSMIQKTTGKFKFEINLKNDSIMNHHTAMVTPQFPVKVTVYLRNSTVSKCTGTLFSPLFSPVDDKTFLPKKQIEICSVPALADFLFLHLCFGFTVARTFSSLIEVIKKIQPDIDLNVAAVGGEGFYFSYDPHDQDDNNQIHVARLAIDSTKLSLVLTSNNSTETRIGMNRIIPVSKRQATMRTAAAANFGTQQHNPDQFSCENGQLYIEHHFGNIKANEKTVMHPSIKRILGLIFEILMFGNNFKEGVEEEAAPAAV